MKKTYFASDFHLGIDTETTSKEREKIIVEWMKSIQSDADTIYLLGDIFDYWFEYKEVVPRGFVRLLGTLGSLVDSGISIIWLTGNHDMWTFGYLESELGVTISKKPISININGKNLFLAHGDGLGHGDHQYKITKWILSNPICQFCFSLIPPRLGLWMMRRSSHGSRFGQLNDEQKELEQDDTLKKYSISILKDQPNIDYFIYGHRHRPQLTELANCNAKFINLGDWTHHYTYGVLSQDGTFELKKYITPS